MSDHPLLRRVAVVLIPVVLLAAAGVVVLRAPGGGPPDLPDPEAMRLVGEGRRSSQDIVAFWEERVAGAPEVAANHIGLAGAELTLARDAGDLVGYEAAERTALTAVGLAPADRSALLTLGAARAGQHRFADALDLANRVLVVDPTSEEGLLAAGDARIELGDYDGARVAYERAEAELGDIAPVLSRRARLEATVGRLENARHLARLALVDAADHDLRNADAAFYWLQLAAYEFALGDPEAAADLLDAALDIDPGNPGATELLGRVLAARGDDIGAIAVYEELVEDGGAADLHGELAELYRRSGRSADADRHVAIGLAIAAETADRFPAERRHLIDFLADHDPDEARRLAALDLSERQDVLSHAWYAWTLLRTGDVTGAREAIEPAMAHRTEDARLLYQAGMIHAAAGEPATAEDLLRRSLELNPGFDVHHAAEAQRVLAGLST